MGPTLGLIAYWTVTHAATSLLPQAALLAPLLRPFLQEEGGLRRAAVSGRAWLKAGLLIAVWRGVPLLCMYTLDGISLPWIPEGHGGSAYWWWLGVALYFGLLYRRLLVGVLLAPLALLWQWLMLAGPLTHWLTTVLPPEGSVPVIVYGAVFGLGVGVMDAAAQRAVRKIAY